MRGWLATSGRASEPAPPRKSSFQVDAVDREGSAAEFLTETVGLDDRCVFRGHHAHRLCVMSTSLPLWNWVVLEPGQCRAPSDAESRPETLPSSHRGHGSVVHSCGPAVKGGDGRGLKAFDDQVDAQRKLPDCDRECDHPYSTMLPRETEQHSEVPGDQQGRADESEERKP